MSVMTMNGWGVSVVMVSWEKNMIFLGLTGETRILRPYKKLYWSQSFLKASSFYVRFMYDNKFSVIVITTAWSVDHQAGAYPCFHNKNCLGMGW